MSLLALEAVSFRRERQPILRSVSFAFPERALVAIHGRPRSGKSTVLHIAAGLLQPTSGAVRFDDSPHLAAQLGSPGGIMLARTSFSPALGPTVLEQVAAPRMAFVSPRRATEEAWALLQRIGIVDLAGEPPRSLHAEEQVRVGIARALISQPRLLLVDEPLRGAEAGRRDELVATFRALRAEQGLSVLLTTTSVKGLGGWQLLPLSDGSLDAPVREHGSGGEVVQLRRRDDGS